MERAQWAWQRTSQLDQLDMWRVNLFGRGHIEHLLIALPEMVFQPLSMVGYFVREQEKLARGDRLQYQIHIRLQWKM